MSIPVNPTVEIKLANGSPVIIGNDKRLTIFAGPCQMESRDHALKLAERLAEIALRLDIGLVYKTSFDKANRTSIDSERGMGLTASIPVFAEVRDKFGLPTLTDVHTAEQCAEIAEVVDVLQIPAFLCRQTDLIEAAARTGRPINVKKGQFLAPADMKHVVSKVAGFGNPNVFACERGATFGYNNLVSDMRALAIMAEIGCPVVFDATHSVMEPGGHGDKSGGRREFVPVLAKAAVSVGVAAVFMETHEDPDNAPSDGPNMVPLNEFEGLVSKLLEYDAITKKSV